MQPVLSRTVSGYCIADRLEGVRGGRGAFRPPWSEAVGAGPVGAERELGPRYVSDGEPTRLAEAHLEESCRLGLRGLRARRKRGGPRPWRTAPAGRHPRLGGLTTPCALGLQQLSAGQCYDPHWAGVLTATSQILGRSVSACVRFTEDFIDL